MNSALMFSKASDEWATPQDFFVALDAEFRFTLDAAATRDNAKCADWMGPDSQHADALMVRNWGQRSLYRCTTIETVWLNPPYSRCRDFVEMACAQSWLGHTVVCLVPSRTDTKWWHELVWNAQTHSPYERTEIRFIKGRLKFGEGKNSAPFPSVVVIFRPPA